MGSSAVATSLESIVFVLFVVFIIIFIYFSFTFNHHWSFYSFNSQFKRIAQSLYYFFSIAILLALLFFIGLYIFDYGI
jgi:choline-glycine betaine transporter